MPVKHEALSYQTTQIFENFQVLNASHNAIKFIEGSIFTDVCNLKFLDLSNNQITHLSDKSFGAMSLLKSIIISNNTLESIDDGVFAELKLNHLDLSCNRLSSDNFLWPTLDIEYLNLTFNAYKEMNASVLESIMTDLWGEKLFRFELTKPLDIIFAGNPFNCEWLVKEVVASKNIRLGRNYVLDAKQSVLKVAGIQCFDDNGTSEHKLIVVESKAEMNDEVGGEISLIVALNSLRHFIFKVESHLEKLLNARNTPMMPSTTIDNFEFKSILLWLLGGCLGVFAALRLLKCLLKKSEQQSEQYRLSRRVEFSINEELKSSIEEK